MVYVLYTPCHGLWHCSQKVISEIDPCNLPVSDLIIRSAMTSLKVDLYSFKSTNRKSYVNGPDRGLLLDEVTNRRS